MSKTPQDYTVKSSRQSNRSKKRKMNESFDPDKRHQKVTFRKYLESLDEELLEAGEDLLENEDEEC